MLSHLSGKNECWLRTSANKQSCKYMGFIKKNSKKKIDKKSGRKQPRANDYELEFEPAPDFEFSLKTRMKLKVEKSPSTTGIKNTPKKTITNPTHR